MATFAVNGLDFPLTVIHTLAMRLVIQNSDNPRLPYRVTGDGLFFECGCPDLPTARYIAYQMRKDWYPSALVSEEIKGEAR